MARRSPDERAAILAKIPEGMSWEDASSKTGIPAGTLRSWAKRQRDAVATGSGVATGPEKRSPEEASRRRAVQIGEDLTDQQADVFWRILDGQSERQIARDTGVGRETIRRWRGEPLFAAHLSGVRADRDTAAQEAACAGKVEGVRAEREIMDGLLADFRVEADPSIRARLAATIRAIAADLMDRGGLPKLERVEHLGEPVDNTARRNPEDVIARMRLLEGGGGGDE